MFYFLLGIYLGVGLLNHTVNSMFNILRDLPNCFPKKLLHFTFSPAMYEGSNFSTVWILQNKNDLTI